MKQNCDFMQQFKRKKQTKDDNALLNLEFIQDEQYDYLADNLTLIEELEEELGLDSFEENN